MRSITKSKQVAAGAAKNTAAGLSLETLESRFNLSTLLGAGALTAGATMRIRAFHGEYATWRPSDASTQTNTNTTPVTVTFTPTASNNNNNGNSNNNTSTNNNSNNSNNHPVVVQPITAATNNNNNNNNSNNNSGDNSSTTATTTTTSNNNNSSNNNNTNTNSNNNNNSSNNNNNNNYNNNTPTPVATPTPTPTPTPVQPAAQNFSNQAATVNTRWMTSFNELDITAANGNNSIEVSQSGNTISVVSNGHTNTYTGNYGTIKVWGGSGNNNITIDGNVTENATIYAGGGTDTLKNFTQGQATIVSVGGSGHDTLQGNGQNTAYWADTTDTINASGTEVANGDVHLISSFAGPGGQNLSLARNSPGINNTGGSGSSGTTTMNNNALWGTGPQTSDVNQGQLSDCYFLGSLESLAAKQPGKLQQMAVNLGDGTYAVQFVRNGQDTYVRVNNQFPAGGYYANGLAYSHPGSSGNIWAMVMEKAYASYRTGQNSYDSLNSGWMDQVYSDLGVNNTDIAGNDFNSIQSAVNSGHAATLGTGTSVSDGALIPWHTYAVTNAWTSNGTQYVQLVNPWGNSTPGGNAMQTINFSADAGNFVGGTITV